LEKLDLFNNFPECVAEDLISEVRREHFDNCCLIILIVNSLIVVLNKLFDFLRQLEWDIG
jgi:hypothetical protein